MTRDELIRQAERLRRAISCGQTFTNLLELVKSDGAIIDAARELDVAICALRQQIGPFELGSELTRARVDLALVALRRALPPTNKT